MEWNTDRNRYRFLTANAEIDARDSLQQASALESFSKEEEEIVKNIEEEGVTENEEEEEIVGTEEDGAKQEEDVIHKQHVLDLFVTRCIQCFSKHRRVERLAADDIFLFSIDLKPKPLPQHEQCTANKINS